MNRRLLANSPVANGWRLLRLEWPDATRIGPGQFVTLALAEGAASLPVHHASQEGWLALLAPPALGSWLSRLAPHAGIEATLDEAAGFELADVGAPPVLLGSGTGVAAALFLAERLDAPPRLVLLGGAEPPPFRPVPSAFMIEGLPPQVIAAAPMLEAAGVPSRLACDEDRPGCFEGSVVELLEIWLATQARRPLTIYACVEKRELGPLRALAARGGHILRALAAP